MKITMIPTNKIYSHPLNPRTDLGDITELTDSIKVMGILQNLTVVPYSPVDHVGLTITDGDGSDCYVVVVGNRRHAAGQKAKLTELPCAVSDMDIKEQIRTMQVENLMREGLTTHQQAKAIQMMMDLGDTVEDIAKATGMSKSKVEKRAKLAVFDPTAFAESEARNPSMDDYLKLAKLEDPDLRNELLSSIGTNDFANDLARARSTIRDRQAKEAKLQVINTFAKRVDKAEADFAMVKTYYNSDKADSIKVPADADTCEYFYTEGYNITVYRRKTEGEITAAEEREKENAERREDYAALSEISLRTFELRTNFMAALTAGQAKKHFAAIASHLADYFRALSFKSWFTLRIDHHLASEMLGVSMAEKTGINADEVKEVAAKWPERTLLTLVYLQLEDNKLSYAKQDWKGGRYVPVHNDCEELNRIYDLLTAIGYPMSEEEKQMRDGTHPLFYKEPEKKAEATTAADAA